jgi:tetratricopeptide (TPR) repeat protein
VSAAGLALLAGDPEPAHKLEVDLRQSSDGQVPVWIAELGWWHYLQGNYQKAADLLSEGLQQRPGHTQIGLRLAWAQIEVHRYGDALQLLEGALYEQQMQPERAMARAAAQWKAQEHEDAMRYFEIALGDQTEWGNPLWVKALYSPLVEQSIQEMQAERERRRLQARNAIIR